MLGIVVSRADEASVHIGEQLRSVADWTETRDAGRPDGEGGGTVYRTRGAELREFDALHLELSGVAAAFDGPDLVVFASRHAGETDELLTAHHTGNFGDAEYGGEAGRFARACPNAHSAVIEALAEHAPEAYEVGMECTHHGPTDVGAPSMFVEVGSAEPQWEDPEAARAAARAILEIRGVAADAPDENGTRRHLVGFGGGHYAPRFERVVRETDWAVGHVGADWSIEALGEWAGDSERRHDDVLRRAFEESGAEYALLEADRPELVERLEGLGYRVVDETFVRETSAVALELVDELESGVEPVADGLRFGTPATDDPSGWHVADLPAELLAEARAIDEAGVRDWVTRHAVAFGTEQNGTVVTGPVVLPDGTARERAIDALAAILGKRYDSVERESGELIAREERFAPELARTAGVPEGPKFGRLAEGQSVTVDGEEIDPERFYRERIRRFTL
jgi:D-aminoacyl-tRNA deacylase